jgi:hypothetical protein
MTGILCSADDWAPGRITVTEVFGHRHSSPRPCDARKTFESTKTAAASWEASRTRMSLTQVPLERVPNHVGAGRSDRLALGYSYPCLQVRVLPCPSSR